MDGLDRTQSAADVVVIGGGPAGTATAIELARLGLSATVLERSSYDRVRIGETLPPAIAPRLARLGVWQPFLDQHHLPSHAVRSAWGSDVLNDMPHLFDPHGTGWHVDRRRFDGLLARRARQVGAAVHLSARVTEVDRIGPGAGWRVAFDHAHGRQVVRARFLVDATGRSSGFRRRMGVVDALHDRLIGSAVCFESDASEPVDGSHILIESVERGWWYAAPQATGRWVVVFMTDLDLYRATRRGSGRTWRECLEETRHMRAHLAALRPATAPRVHPAHSHTTVQLAHGDWLPVGDAMQSVDPLSGLGVCNALQMAERAAAALRAHLDGGRDALASYLAETIHASGRCLETRRFYYAKESRWPTSEFWRRRQARGPEASVHAHAGAMGASAVS